jgi:rhodanese-related sulfurtransferase
MQRLTASPPPPPPHPHPHPHPAVVVIDVREPAELAKTGHIPTALNVPIASSPDAFFLPEQEFEERFGFPRPAQDAEVVFYCKSGVRSRAAARLAAQARFGGSTAEFPGSWVEWEARGGKVERG